MPNKISDGFLDQQQFYRVQEATPPLQACKALFIAAESDGSPEVHSMLDKMIQAVKLQPGSSAQVLHLKPAEVVHWYQLQQQTGAAYTVIFGIAPKQLQLQVEFPPFRVTSFLGHQFLFASSLQVIHQEKNQKAQLWTALQQLFGLTPNA